MKKNLFILISFLVFSTTKAQMWCPPGATWHYREYMQYTPYFDGNIKLVVTNTVLINTITCNNMVGTFNGVSNFPNAPVSTINNFVNFQTYENNKVVYIYNSVTLGFDTIANFNANIGDKWRVIRFKFDTCQYHQVRTQVTVIDTGHVTINNLNLKKVKVTYLSYQSTGSQTVTLVEKIGALSGFLFPFTYNNCFTDSPDYGNFVCYSDDNFALYDPSSTICDYIPTGINENSISNISISLYPNPANTILNIGIENPSQLQNTTVKITTPIGQKVIESKLEQTIDISSFQNGIYFLQVFEDGKLISTQKIIKE